MQAVTETRTARPILVEGFLNDPYPTYRELLREGPLHYVALGPGFNAVFSYSLASSVMKDPRFSAKRTSALMLAVPEEHRAQYAPLVKTLGLWLLFMDAPEHTRLRKLMNKGFSPAVADALRPRIDAIVDKMLEAMGGKAEAELMRELAHPFPAHVIAELLAVPQSMQEDLIRWSEAIALFIGNPRRTLEQCTAAQDALLALTDFFRSAVAERRRNRGTDLISLLLDIEADGEVLTEDELYAQCVMLLFGGHETTRNLIGNGIFTLLQHPEELARLRDSPELIRSGVEELLRYQSPVQYIARLAKEDVEIEGVQLRTGEPLLIMLGAANRDPKQFRDPDLPNLARANNTHLAFGAGPHFCIGNQIARMEAQAAILKTVQKFPRLRFTAEAPEWAPNYALRGFKSLPVALS